MITIQEHQFDASLMKLLEVWGEQCNYVVD